MFGAHLTLMVPAKRAMRHTAGECTRMVCDLLRDAPEAVPTGLIVTSIMQRKGIPGGDVRARDLIHRTVLSSGMAFRQVARAIG